MNEIWKDVERYKGKYQVSNLGRVKSLNYRGNTHTEKILKPISRGKSGYIYVDLYDNNYKPHKESIHRLVAETFIDNPLNLPCVNHKNEIKSDNNVDNLEWCTHKYNSNYGTIKEKLSTSAKQKPTWQYAVNASKKKINQYSLDNEFIQTWDCAADIARYLNKTNGSNIIACCKGKKKSCYGYIWRYNL